MTEPLPSASLAEQMVPLGHIDAALTELQAQQALSPDQANLIRARLTLKQQPGEALTSAAQASTTQSSSAQPASAEAGKISWLSLISEAAAYVSAGFVFAAFVLIFGDTFADLSNRAQALVLGGISATLAATAIAIHRGGTPAKDPAHPKENARLRAASVLALSGALAASVAFLLLIEPQAEWPEAPLLWSLVLFATSGVIYAWLRSFVAQVAWSIASIIVTFTFASWIDSCHAWLGCSAPDFGPDFEFAPYIPLVTGLLWLTVAQTRAPRYSYLAILTGGGLTLAGLIWLATDSMLDRNAGNLLPYLLMGALTAWAFLRYRSVRDWSYLVVAVVSMTVAVPMFVSEYAPNTVGAGGMFLVTGLALASASALGFKLATGDPDE